uniref:Uncharacterized protein n=1 Tax=Siphoviridae sp. ctFSL3 TaxID=2825404 RepID=A0A8S5PED5_9CAUD|nr:MAG TPA: hypothetical protein [Siphoviridae sp. ctFSL3]DAI55611.1 MAG TPA: hypothetical protein [Caudoviricetes sp.]
MYYNMIWSCQMGGLGLNLTSGGIVYVRVCY